MRSLNKIAGITRINPLRNTRVVEELNIKPVDYRGTYTVWKTIENQKKHMRSEYKVKINFEDHD